MKKEKEKQWRGEQEGQKVKENKYFRINSSFDKEFDLDQKLNDMYSLKNII